MYLVSIKLIFLPYKITVKVLVKFSYDFDSLIVKSEPFYLHSLSINNKFKTDSESGPLGNDSSKHMLFLQFKHLTMNLTAKMIRLLSKVCYKLFIKRSYKNVSSPIRNGRLGTTRWGLLYSLVRSSIGDR